MILRECILRLMQKQNLTAEDCRQAINEIIIEDANLLQIAAFLVLLRAKPETPTEIVGIVQALREKMHHVPVQGKLMDIVGTGGDNAKTINISTGAAILAASCGVKIAKHGNRAVSSLCGSADVLEELGIDLELSAENVAASIRDVGIGFCYSPNFNPAMQQLRTLRRQLNVPTTFNLIGPLLNPAQATHYLLGVYNEELLTILPEVLQQLGVEHALVVHGDGLDEISCVGPVKAVEVTRDNIRHMVIDPKEFGFSYCWREDLQGGTAHVNAALLRQAFEGKSGPISETLILNCATALWIYGMHPSIAAALSHARENLHNGAALKLLQRWIEVSSNK